LIGCALGILASDMAVADSLEPKTRQAQKPAQMPVAPPPIAGQMKLSLAEIAEMSTQAAAGPSIKGSGERSDADVLDAAEPAENGSFRLLGEVVPPGTATRLSWTPQLTFESLAAPTPVLVMNGARPGPTLCITGAVHGDEINGIEIIRRVFFELDPEQLSGVLIGVPIVNQMAFRRNSRYLPDRRDLNRFFPGNPRGSSASRIAYTFFNEIVRNCDALVDLHTGSFHRTNLPQLRADLTDQRVAQLAHGFGGMVVLQSSGAPGTLRREASRQGIPAVTFEAGEPLRIQTAVVKDGVERIRALMTNLGLYSRPFFWTKTEPVYLKSRWVRSEQGGLLLNQTSVGQSVLRGDVLGKVVNPVTNDEYLIKSPYSGQIIGMALNQVVMPGYAAYHIGLQVSDPASAAEDSAGNAEEMGIEDPAEGIDSPRFDVDEE